MRDERTFIVRLPPEASSDRLRSALSSLKDSNAVILKTSSGKLIEFTADSPGCALLKIKLLCRDAVVKERKSSGEVDVLDTEIPEWVEGIIVCPNKNCITGQPKEPTMPKFRVVTTNPPKIQCYYCGRYVSEDSLSSQLS